MSDVFTKLETIKKVLPPTNGYQEDVDKISRFVRQTLNLYRILKTEHNGYPVMENIDEEIKRFEERWGNGTHS